MVNHLFLFPLIIPHPIDLHIDWQLLRIDRTDPTATQLGIQAKMERIVREGELSILATINLRIANGTLPVREIDQTIRIHLHRIDIKALLIDRRRRVFGRVIPFEVNRIPTGAFFGN